MAQMAIGRWVSSPWLVPDLTLLSMAVLILRLPGHPLTPAWLAGVAAMALAVQHPLWMGMAYLAAGAAVKWMAHQWEVTDPSRERLVIGIAQGGLLILLASTGPVTVGLIVMGGLRVGLTLLCLPLMRAFVHRFVVPRPS
ncbi:MAG: hypothetical protein HY596_04525 [Candidatus Omnitrophica bacterium]|nr:hypothetical protein [Candidatus Omnitrophota bacterium]